MDHQSRWHYTLPLHIHLLLKIDNSVSFSCESTYPFIARVSHSAYNKKGGGGGGKDMQNILGAPQHAMLTSILCIRNSFEPVKYRATYIMYALSTTGRTRTLARKCACVLRETAVKW